MNVQKHPHSDPQYYCRMYKSVNTYFIKKIIFFTFKHFFLIEKVFEFIC